MRQCEGSLGFHELTASAGESIFHRDVNKSENKSTLITFFLPPRSAQVVTPSCSRSSPLLSRPAWSRRRSSWSWSTTWAPSRPCPPCRAPMQKGQRSAPWKTSRSPSRRPPPCLQVWLQDIELETPQHNILCRVCVVSLKAAVRMCSWQATALSSRRVRWTRCSQSSPANGRDSALATRSWKWWVAPLVLTFSASFLRWRDPSAVCFLHLHLQENRSMQQTMQALQNELDSLRADNIKLYEKIKFLQSYPGRVCQRDIWVHFHSIIEDGNSNKGFLCAVGWR